MYSSQASQWATKFIQLCFQLSVSEQQVMLVKKTLQDLRQSAKHMSDFQWINNSKKLAGLTEY